MSRDNKRFKQDLSGNVPAILPNLPASTEDSALGNSLVEESKGCILIFNCLPPEIILKIFSHLSQNELGKIARVCKLWQNFSKSPVLWVKVDVKLKQIADSQFFEATHFCKYLPSCVTHLKLDFGSRYSDNNGRHDFEEFCTNVKEKFPDLQALFLHSAELPVNLSSIINIFAHFIPNLLILGLRFSNFSFNTAINYNVISQVEVLDISECEMSLFLEQPFWRMPLKKLYATNLESFILSFWRYQDSMFLKDLEVLNLHGAIIPSQIIRRLLNDALLLTELYLCRPWLKDFDNSDFKIFAFPCLKIICLIDFPLLTCTDVISIIQSCPSIQEIYVNEELSQAYREHPSVKAKLHQSNIVKSIVNCPHYHDIDNICG